MKKLYYSHDRLLVGFLKGILDEHGISCVIKNEYLAGGIGELPPLECWPELWVIEDQDVPQAQQLIESVLHATHPMSKAWYCKACGEWLEPQFTDCWRCGKSKQ